MANSERAIRELQSHHTIQTFTQFELLENHLDLAYIKSNLEKGTKIVNSVSLGNFFPPKRIDRLVEMGLELKNRGIPFSHWHIGDGPQMENVRNELERNGLENHIKLLGKRHDVYRLMSQACFLVHFSDYEGTPNAVMEAMASGLPVISTNCGDVKRFLEHGTNGFLVDPWNVTMLGDYYQQYWEDKELLQSHAVNSRDRIKELDITHLSEKFANTLNRFGYTLDA